MMSYVDQHVSKYCYVLLCSAALVAASQIQNLAGTADIHPLLLVMLSRC
jgi:hypothetical protein